jgi:hypothetical protein
MSTYTIRCLCGRSSPKLGSRESMRSWHADHKRDSCVARRSSPTAVTSRAAVGRARLLEELASLRAHVRMFEKIPEPAEQSAEHLWGAPSGSSFANGEMGRPRPRNARFVASLRNTSFRA